MPNAAPHFRDVPCCWYKRSRRSHVKVPEQDECVQSNMAGLAQPEAARGGCFGQGLEDGGCEEGVLCWQRINLAYDAKSSLHCIARRFWPCTNRTIICT